MIKYPGDESPFPLSLQLSMEATGHTMDLVVLLQIKHPSSRCLSTTQYKPGELIICVK